MELAENTVCCVKDFSGYCGKKMFPLVLLGVLAAKFISVPQCCTSQWHITLQLPGRSFALVLGLLIFQCHLAAVCCELLTPVISPAIGTDMCRSLTFKLRTVPLPAKYG